MTPAEKEKEIKRLAQIINQLVHFFRIIKAK